MQNQVNPVDLAINWVNLFSAKERDELARLVLPALLQDFGADPIDPSAVLQTWLQNLNSLEPRQIIGRLLNFCSAVEFFALEDRGSAAGWDHLFKVNEAVRDALLNKGHTLDYVAPLSEAILEIPLRRMRWLHQSERWRSLRRGYLSESSLRKWLKASDRAWLLVPVG